MALRLRVVSEHAAHMGDRSTTVFGVHGGSIGRAPDNDWILPDTDRYLSGKHARVDFRAGNYVLVDTSSNGTYVNGAQVPLGKYHDYVLKDGDYIRIGEFELLASIDKTNDFPPEDNAFVAYDGHAVSSAIRKSTANDLGEDLDLSQLFEASDVSMEHSRGTPRDLAAGHSGRLPRGTSPREVSPREVSPREVSPTDSGVLPRDAYGQAITEHAPPPMLTRAELEADAASTPWHMMTRPLKVEGAKPPASAAPQPRPQNPQLFDGDFGAGLAAFCRGAGIDPASLPADARSAMLQLAGQLMREAVLGVMDLNQSSNEFRSRFRIAPPVNDGPESPLNFSRGVDEALVRLLTNLSTRAGSVEVIRQNFRELKAHNICTFAATRAAFEDFLGRVDPKELEERFERGTKRGVFGSQSTSRYWDLYAELYAGLVQRPADGFPHLFTETFAKAFEAKWRHLVLPKRALGAERGRDAGQPGDPNYQAVGDL